jgi:hypothetical protein
MRFFLLLVLSTEPALLAACLFLDVKQFGQGGPDSISGLFMDSLNAP